jgi:FkbM family methyltransferase
MNTPRTSPDQADYDGPDAQVLRCVIAYNRHGGYGVPRSSMHRPCAQTILAGGVFEPPTVAALEHHGRQGDIVHAGTFFGDMLPAAARACGPSGIVWACEPNQENFRCASLTIAINGLTNVRLHHGALGEKSGLASLMVRSLGGKALGGGSRVVEPGAAPADATYEVPVLRIDDLVPADRPVALIQLDVERQERQALTGALATIRRCRPALIVETVPDDAWIAANLVPLGYGPAGMVGPNALFVAGPGRDVS